MCAMVLVWRSKNTLQKLVLFAGQRWCTPLIPALGRQKQVDLCESEASLVYRVSSRTARAAQRNFVSKNNWWGWRLNLEL